jgi:hypothetical protein
MLGPVIKVRSSPMVTARQIQRIPTRGLHTKTPSKISKTIPSSPSTAIPTNQKRSISLHFPPRGFAARYPATSVVARLIASSVLGVTLVIGAILVHDATTYSERHVDRVPANPLALHPRRGGKKNLPIFEVNLDDEEDETKKAMSGKPRLVVIGGGWGVSLTRSSYT